MPRTLRVPFPELLREERYNGRNNMTKLRTNFEILETFGIEIENHIVRPSFNLPKGFNFSHDASTETPCEANNNFLKITGEGKNHLHTGTRTFGAEIISSYPLKICDEDIYKIKEVIDNIYLNGGAYNSNRSGIHIHITIPKSLKIIKNILIHALNVEDIFFYLGGMGQEFRGIHNDSIYCRPLTDKGPQIIRGKNSKYFAQVFNVFDLLDAEDLDDFALKYGNILNYGPRGYQPPRYSWINFVTVFRQGSLEFRIFNTTLSTGLLKASINFCMEFTKYCLINSFTDSLKLPEINSIFKNPSKESILRRFLDLAELINLNEKYTQILYNGILDVPEINLENTYVYSHLMYHARGDKTDKTGYWKNSAYLPKRIKEEEIKIPKFEDIHNLIRR